ncbi:MAG: substrate-binding domain-containing protein [Ignavibacteriaceae bacterium]|nr:substrate-binding domain-containing protein [Ignavibacteriaceae bacterium]
MKKVSYLGYLTCIITLFNFISCNQNQNGEIEDTPTSGKINISVDETFKPIIETEISTFQSIYNNAQINASYKSEGNAFQDLLDDSARIIIVTRELTPQEKKHFENIKLFPRVTKIAYDAVSFVTNNSNQDTQFTDDQIKKIITGEIGTWKQLNPKSNNSPIQIVFDNNNSGTLRFLKEYSGGKNLSKTSSASTSSEAVIDYVSKNKNALGVLGVTWVTDRRDSTLMSFVNKVRVDEISPPDSSEGRGEFYKPYQAYIATKYYPLWRTVYVISREARAGLGTGFTSFVASDKGQRIILKSGLVPASQPVRLVELHNNNINITK